MHIDENGHTCPCFPVLQYTQCTPDVENLGPGQLTSVHTFHANAYNHRCQAYNLFSDEACIKTVIIYRPIIICSTSLSFIIVG